MTVSDSLHLLQKEDSLMRMRDALVSVNKDVFKWQFDTNQFSKMVVLVGSLENMTSHMGHIAPKSIDHHRSPVPVVG